jgi:hypothetical protein
MMCGHMGCALLSSPIYLKIPTLSDPQKSERPWVLYPHMVIMFKCGNLWHKKYIMQPRSIH